MNTAYNVILTIRLENLVLYSPPLVVASAVIIKNNDTKMIRKFIILNSNIPRLFLSHL